MTGALSSFVVATFLRFYRTTMADFRSLSEQIRRKNENPTALKTCPELGDAGQALLAEGARAILGITLEASRSPRKRVERGAALEAPAAPSTGKRGRRESRGRPKTGVSVAQRP